MMIGHYKYINYLFLTLKIIFNSLNNIKKKINQIIIILWHYSHDVKKTDLVLLHIPLQSA